KYRCASVRRGHRYSAPRPCAEDSDSLSIGSEGLLYGSSQLQWRDQVGFPTHGCVHWRVLVEVLTSFEFRKRDYQDPGASLRPDEDVWTYARSVSLSPHLHQARCGSRRKPPSSSLSHSPATLYSP